MNHLFSRIFSKFGRGAEPETPPLIPWQEVPEDGRKDWLLSMLRRVEAVDPERCMFGARTHQYRLEPPIDAQTLRAAEKENGFTLPEDYFWFLSEVGNGGAGPNYGLYAFGSHEQEEEFPYLSSEPVLEPKDSKEAYERFVAPYKDAPDGKPPKTLWQGLLTVGTVGGTCDMMLVVSGPDRGRILHVDRDLDRPYYSPDASFLDWYARWLEEAAAGYDMSHFDSRIGGDADELTARYPIADDTEKGQILQAMFKFPAVEEPIVRRLARLHIQEENPVLKGYLMRHLYRFHYGKADSLLHDALKDERYRLQALVALWGRYCCDREPQPEEWYQDVLESLQETAKEPDTTAFRMGLDLVTQSPCFRMEDLEPFIASGTEELQIAIYNQCAPRAMPLHTALCYTRQLEESCRGNDTAEIGKWLERAARIYCRNPALRQELEGVLKPICLSLQQELDSGEMEVPSDVRASIDLILKDAD